jgi:hypothetical protein
VAPHIFEPAEDTRRFAAADSDAAAATIVTPMETPPVPPTPPGPCKRGPPRRIHVSRTLPKGHPNAAFCKHDATVCLVIDCKLDRIDAIKAYLDECSRARLFRYGMNVSDTALMTCLVASAAQGLHVHFVDGGGYTSAAKTLKAAAGTLAAGR